MTQFNIAQFCQLMKESKVNNTANIIFIDNVLQDYMKKRALSAHFVYRDDDDINNLEAIEFKEIYNYFLDSHPSKDVIAETIYEGINHFFGQFLSELPMRMHHKPPECECGFDNLANIKGNLYKFITEHNGDISECIKHKSMFLEQNFKDVVSKGVIN